MGVDCRLENVMWILSTILGQTEAAPLAQLEAHLTLIKGSTPPGCLSLSLPSLMASSYKSTWRPSWPGQHPSFCSPGLELNFGKMGTWLPAIFLLQVP